MRQDATATWDDRFPALDAMRGVAALMVVVLHASRMLAGQWVPGGYLAVDLFFALSGFVIAHAYDRRLADGLPGGRFLLMRALRFWPLYALGVALGLVHQLMLVATHNPHAMPLASLSIAATLQLAFLPGALAGGAGNLFPLNAPSWSLFLELMVNAAFGLCFAYLTRARLIAVAAAAVPFLILAAFHAGTLDLGATTATLSGGMARMLYAFAMGILIHRGGWHLPALPLPILLALVVAALAAPVPGGWRPVYDTAFALIGSPLLVAFGATSRPVAGETRAAEWLGLISYPVYAIHRPLIDLATPIAEGLHLPVILRALALLGGLAVAAVLLDRLYDRPLRKTLARLTTRRPERAVPEIARPAASPARLRRSPRTAPVAVRAGRVGRRGPATVSA